MTVVIERAIVNPTETHFQARSDGNKLVILPAGNYAEGDYVDVIITGASAHVLKGSPLDSEK